MCVNSLVKPLALLLGNAAGVDDSFRGPALAVLHPLGHVGHLGHGLPGGGGQGGERGQGLWRQPRAGPQGLQLGEGAGPVRARHDGRDGRAGRQRVHVLAQVQEVEGLQGARRDVRLGGPRGRQMERLPELGAGQWSRVLRRG